MRCPYCSHSETQVLDSRDLGKEIRRRRACLKCKKRFTTYERVEIINLVIIKKDGTREQYNRQKVKNGISRACEKRPITNAQIEKAIDQIEQKLKSMKSTEVSSRTVGELVMNKLKTLDKVAYIRFASVYREFTDLESFQKELQNLLKRKKTAKNKRDKHG